MFEVFNYYLTIEVFKYFSTLLMRHRNFKFQDVGRRNVGYVQIEKFLRTKRSRETNCVTV